MKNVMILFFTAVLFSCETSIELDPQVAKEVLTDYVWNCNESKDPGKWVENQELLTDDFKREYKKMMEEAWKNDPELGLGFDPIFNAQDYSTRGYEISSFDSKTGLVLLRGVGSLSNFNVRFRVKIVDNKCLVDGAGAIRMGHLN